MKEWRNKQYFVSVWDASVYLEIKTEVPYFTGKSLTFQEFISGKYNAVVKKNFSQHVLREIQSAIAHKKEQKWHLGANKAVVTPAQVTIGEQDRYGGVGTTFSAIEFLSGANQSLIKNYFGEAVLQEILDYANVIDKAS